jgi:DNA gyrase subunit A
MSAQDEHENRRQRLRESIAMAEALLMVANDVQRFLAIVVEAPDNESSILALRQTYGFDEVYARAALDVQVRRLSSLERTRFAEGRDNLIRDLAALEERT